MSLLRVSPLRSGNVEEVATPTFNSDIPEPSCLAIHPVREIALGSSRELDEAEGAVPMSLPELGPDPPKEAEAISLLHSVQSLPHEQSEQPAVVASVQESSFPPAHASSQVIPTENVDEEVCLAEPALVPLPEQHLKLLSVEYLQLDNSARPDVSTIIGQLEMVQDIILSKDDSTAGSSLENVAVPLEAVEPTYNGPTLVCSATKAEVPIEQSDVAQSNKETIPPFHTLGPSLSDSVEVSGVAQLSQLPPVAALHSLNELGIHPQAAVSCTEKEPCAIELPPSPLLVPQTGECPSQEKLTYRPMLPLADSSSIVQAVLDDVVEVSRKTEDLSDMDLAQRPILPLTDSSSAIESAVGPVVSQDSHAARHEVGRNDETILRLAAETHDTSSPIDVVARRTWKLEMGVTQKHIPVCVRAVHLTLGYSLTWWLSKSPMF
ncbi:hypothetical protein PHLCEN_2v6054 [Hermanssonia centrifuga]|uniref:Uncharacterized protein n=1 Tax=Hermanssonia centrifuga TaxID=98765 RepID=A0A2R6P1A8_9APHY|nr:hypothetical protein PHLCEN_2v6054 [Hermanssonia centrifuga]